MADTDDMTTPIVTRLLPGVQDSTVRAALLAISASASVSLLLKLLEQSDLQLGPLYEQGTSVAGQTVPAIAEVLSTAHAAVFLKYEKLYSQDRLDASG